MKEEDFKFFFDCLGIFNHYKYFTDELWRKVPGRKKEDEAEVKCAFLHLWCHHHFGTYSTPCGCGWFTLWEDCPPHFTAKETYQEYIDKWKDVFDDYTKWCINQR